MTIMKRLAAACAVAAGLALAGAAGAQAAGKSLQPTLGDDGLYHHDWFMDSFLGLADDLNESHQAGKRMVVVFEQIGCIYCKKMQTEVLADPDVQAYVRENYNVVQLNLWGDREVTDLDGEALPEKELARKWGVLFTPTIVFMPETVAEAGGRNGKDAAVAMMPGAFGKLTFKALFEWVKERRYDSGEPFQKYVIEKMQKKGS